MSSAHREIEQDGGKPLVISPRRWKPVLFAADALVFVLAGPLIGLAHDWRGSANVVVATQSVTGGDSAHFTA